MRRIAAALLVGGLLAGALAEGAVAGKKKKRTSRVAVVVYTSPSIGSADLTGTCTDSCVTFGVGPTERFVSLKITDDSGLTPAATIGQDQDPGDQFVDRVGEICGATEEPLAVMPGIEINVWVWAAPRFVTGGGLCMGAGTAGEVEATFSNVP